MYFAISPLNVDAMVPALLAAFAEASGSNETPSLNFYALVDCAFDESIVKRSAKTGIAVYAGTSLAELGDVSPRVVALECEPSAREAQLRWLIRSCADMPMLSFIASPLSAAELASGLAGLVLARTPDGLEWPLRFADTRVLPSLLRTLDARQQHAHLPPLGHWWWPDRAGQLQVFRPSTAPLGSAGAGALALSEQQFAQMVADSEADTLLAQLYEARPELVRLHSPQDNHALVDQAVRLAQQRGFHAIPVQLRLAAIALLLGPGFAEQPDIAAALNSASSDDDLLQRLDHLPAHVWD